jgi:hypothetical protein
VQCWAPLVTIALRKERQPERMEPPQVALIGANAVTKLVFSICEALDTRGVLSDSATESRGVSVKAGAPF